MKKHLGKIIAAIVLLLVTILIIVFQHNFDKRQDSEKKYSEFSGFYFDTYISVKLYYDSSADYVNIAKNKNMSVDNYFKETFDYIDELCKEYDALCDRFDENSDVYKLNEKKTAFVKLKTINIISNALNYSAMTNGAFDITMGTITKGYSASEKTIYDKETAEKLLHDVSFRNIEADILYGSEEGACRVKLNGENTCIDLGGITKGYVSDKIATYIMNRGINSALINLGGNITLVGTKQNSQNFVIGIQKPFSDTGEYISAVMLNPYTRNDSQKSVVTSGIYERYFEKDGKMYHHIFDPKTGMPVENNLYSVTVICTNSAMADAFSTALFVMGLEDGMWFVNNTDDLECVFIDNEYNLHYSDGLKFENNIFTLK